MRNIFDQYYKEYDSWYDKNKFAFLSEVKAIKKVLPAKGKGLEIGVGTGRFAEALGIDVGIDNSKKMIEIAKQRGLNVKYAKAEKLPFENAEFDYVLIVVTLCFVENPEKVIKEAKRVLKKGGRIILGIVDKNSFLGKFYKKKKSIFYKYVRFFSPDEIKNLLASKGFKEFLFYQTIFNLPEEIAHLQKSERHFGKGGFVVVSAKK